MGMLTESIVWKPSTSDGDFFQTEIIGDVGHGYLRKTKFRIKIAREDEGAGSGNWKRHIVGRYQISFITTCLHLQSVLSFHLLLQNCLESTHLLSLSSISPPPSSLL